MDKLKSGNENYLDASSLEPLKILGTTRKEIDYDKIQSIDDIREIFRCMILTVWDDGTDNFKNVRHLYKED